MKYRSFAKNMSRGDTIIEVMFATAVASLIIVLAMAVMNRGVATTQMSIEHTFVRQAIDGQAEALRYLRDSYQDKTNVVDWSDIRGSYTKANSLITPFGNCPSASIPQKSFYIDTTASAGNRVKIYQGSALTSEVFAVPGKGLWIEASESSSPSSTQRYIDFHIRACWEPPFSGPTATMGTIVRLYYE